MLKQCYKHKREKGVPQVSRNMEFTPTPSMSLPTPANTSTVLEPPLEPSASATTSTTIPHLETEFLTEMDSVGTQFGVVLGADGFDWDGLLGNGDWLMNISGWNDSLLDGQFMTDQ